MSADVLEFVHSGAAAAGGTQLDAALCLGGTRSATRVEALCASRPMALPGLQIIFAAGVNGPGNGALRVVGDSVVRWTAPGDAEGADTTIANGATVPVYSDDADKFILLRRTTADALRGQETVQLLDVLHNAVSGADFEESEAGAGEAKYRGNFFYNSGALDITNLKVWFDPDQVGLARMAKETPSSDAIQTIADELTQPTGLTWVAPTTEGAALSIGTVAAGASHGLWVENYVNASTTPAVARQDVILHWSFTYDGNSYSGSSRGLRSTLNAAFYEVYSETVVPDPATHTPKVTGASLPLVYAASYTAGTYYVTTYFVDRFGLRSAAKAVEELVILGDGSAGNPAPQGPSEVQLLSGTSGIGVLTGLYFPRMEGETDAQVAARRATHWVWWYSADGSAINPDADTPTGTQAMLGVDREYFSWDGTAGLDGAPLTAVLRTRRVDGDGTWDSANVEEVSATAEVEGPGLPDSRATFGRAFSILTPPETYAGGTFYVHTGTNVRFVVAPGSVRFYTSSKLIWRAVFDSERIAESKLYIPSGISIISDATAWDPGAISGAGYGAESVFGDPVYLFYQASESLPRQETVRVNRTLSEFRHNGTFLESQTLTAFNAAGPGRTRYNETRWQIWDRSTMRFVSYLQLDSAGLKSALPLDNSLTEAQVEALLF